MPDDPGTAGTEEPAATEEPERQRRVIHHVGDVNLDPSYVPVLRDEGFAAAWAGARDTFAEADLVLANLECAATEGGTPQPKHFVFRCCLDGLGPMRDAGVDVVTLANNHRGRATTAVAEDVIDPEGEVTACLIPFELDASGVPHPTGGPRCGSGWPRVLCGASTCPCGPCTPRTTCERGSTVHGPLATPRPVRGPSPSPHPERHHADPPPHRRQPRQRRCAGPRRLRHRRTRRPR